MLVGWPRSVHFREMALCVTMYVDFHSLDSKRIVPGTPLPYCDNLSACTNELQQFFSCCNAVGVNMAR